MTVLWAKKAYDDLEGIANYLADLSNDAAERTIDRIQKAVLVLGEFPHLGAKVDETGFRKPATLRTAIPGALRQISDVRELAPTFATARLVRGRCIPRRVDG